MGEDTNTTGTTAQQNTQHGQQQTPPPDAAQNTGTQGDAQTAQSIPYDRFKEVNERAKKAEAELAKIQAEQEAARQAKLAADGNFQEIIAGLEPKAKRVDELEGVVKTLLDAELEKVPEQFRTLIPQGDVVSRLNWVQQAKASGLFAGRAAPNTDAGAQGGQEANPAKLTPEELAICQRYHISPEVYAKRKAEGNI
jgi:hypothetical protein